MVPFTRVTPIEELAPRFKFLKITLRNCHQRRQASRAAGRRRQFCPEPAKRVGGERHLSKMNRDATFVIAVGKARVGSRREGKAHCSPRVPGNRPGVSGVRAISRSLACLVNTLRPSQTLLKSRRAARASWLPPLAGAAVGPARQFQYDRGAIMQCGWPPGEVHMKRQDVNEYRMRGTLALPYIIQVGLGRC